MSYPTESHVVAEDHRGMLLDEYAALVWPDLSKGTLRRLIREGLINVEGQQVLPSFRLHTGQLILLEQEIETLPVKRIKASKLELEVLYQDEHLLAVNKPAGIPVEPSRWGEHLEHMGRALLAWAEANKRADGLLDKRPRALHRLDMGTSGVLLYALSLDAERHYRELFAQREVAKTYHAFVLGEVRQAGTVDLALAPQGSSGSRMAVVEKGGKPSLTEYSPLQRFRGYTLIEARPKTGRTHQIRVHMAAIGHPLMVDPLYAGREAIMLSELKAGYRPKKGRPEKPLINRLTLHSSAVRLKGLDGAEICIEAEYPKDLRILLSKMEKWRAHPSRPQ
jgi:23S rRNA pseudouridine1911/1915/1917 synthase